MALKQNTIYVYFKGKHLITSKSQYQYNHGQFLYFADLDLPQTFEVHFSNRDRGDSKPQVGSNKLVEIPDEYYWSGALMIYAWIYLHTGKDDGETVYEVRIPLTKRAKPTDEKPLPQQQGVIDRTIAELNNAVNVTTENANKTEADKTQVASIKNEVVTLKENIDTTATTVTQKAQEAVNAANASETSAQNAAGYENNAHNYSDEARQYAESALESKNIANQKSEIATNASTEAMGYRDEALEAKNQAVQAKQNIVDYRDETKGYRDETLTAKDDVQILKRQIEGISDTVNENAQSASQSANSASQSANSANQSASSASQSANSASQSAIQAEQFKNQSEANVTHYPKVINNYWYVWDAVNEEYVNTNVDAHGVKGDKGDIGDSGVYIGTDEPTDEDIDVWIDSDGTADDIVTDVQINGASIVSDGVANVSVPLRIKDDSSENGGVIEGSVSGNNSNSAIGLYSHAEGNATNASGGASHSEGSRTTASGNYSHSEGYMTTSSGIGSHSEGQYTKATNYQSHAEGAFTTASGAYSHTEGLYTTANHRSQHAFGEYNIKDSSISSANERGNYIEIVGNGFYDNDYHYSNARTLDWDGNEKLAGSLTLGMDTNDETNISANELKKLKEMNPVDDVQINGTSIVENGVANVPIASSQNFGVVKVYHANGLTVNYSDKQLIVNEASDAQVKNGASGHRPITAGLQDKSTFYGLAKAAGDTTQSQSSNAVGNYTEDAKSKISEMLGGSVSVSGTTPTIVAKSGIRYVCGEVATLDFTPSASGICDVVFTSGSTPTVVTLPSTVKFPDGSFTAEADTTYEINILDGVYGAVMAWT